MYVQSSTEARSCRGKAISLLTGLCVRVRTCVCVRGRVGLCMRISACSLANSARNAYAPCCDAPQSQPHSSELSHKRCNFRKKVTEHKICFDFPYNFCLRHFSL